MATIKFWRGNVLPDVTDANTLYFIKPSGAELGKLYLGNTPIANWVDLNAGVKSVVDGDDNGTIKVDDVPITVYDDSELVEKANSNTTKIETLYTYGTQDMTPGETPLETGKFYFVYEALEGDVIEGDVISFTIDSTTYQAISGMTWANWVGSDYNTGGFVLVGSGVYSGGSIVCTSQTRDTSVSTSDSIIPNSAYFLVSTEKE